MRPLRAAGFTLLEILVVVVIVGIMASLALSTVTDRVLDDRVEGEAKRLKAVIGLAREEAEMKNITLGLIVGDDGYRLVRVEAIPPPPPPAPGAVPVSLPNGQVPGDLGIMPYTPAADGPLRARELAEPVRISALYADERPVPLASKAAENRETPTAQNLPTPMSEGSSGERPVASAAAPLPTRDTARQDMPQMLLQPGGDSTPVSFVFTAPGLKHEGWRLNLDAWGHGDVERLATRARR